MEDDEVVFENSALYQHLQEAGFSRDDISPETVCSAYKLAEHELLRETAKKEHEEEETRNRQKVKVTALGLFIGTCKWLLGYPAYQQEIRHKHQVFTSDLTIDLLDSDLMEEDDYDHVDNFFTTVRERAIGNAESVGEFVKHLILAVIVLGYGFARVIQIKRSGVANMHMWSMDVLTVSIICLALLPVLLKVIIVESLAYRIRRRRVDINILVENMGKLRKTCKKSLRLIQEKELVSRGFTMVSGQSPIERLEQCQIQRATQRQCPQLRKKLYHTTRTLMLAFKQATATFLSKYPWRSGEGEEGGSYLAHIPLEEYGPCVCLPEDDLQLDHATDQYSITALKAMVNLCNVHISEFLRVVNLSLLSRAFVYKHRDFLRIVDLLTQQEEHVTAPLQELDTCFTMHRSGTSSSPSTDKKKKQPTEGPAAPTYTAVHSLKLHLQAALKRVEGLESSLEPHAEVEAPSPSEEQMTTIDSDLQLTKTELEACKDCWEEAVTRAEKISNKPQAKEAEPSPEDIDVAEPEETEPIALFAPEAEPRVQDQVFEAYIEAEMDSSEWDTEPLLSLEEREKKKKEKQEALRMLKELKTVMGVKAQEREERERIAVQRMKDENTQENTDTASVKTVEAMEDFGLRKRNIVEHDSEITAFCTKCNASNSGAGDRCSCVMSASALDLERAKCDELSMGGKAWDDLGNVPYRPPRGRIEVGEEEEEEDEDSMEKRRERLGRAAAAGGMGMGFTFNVAAVAAARGQQLAALNDGDTFGDDGSDEEEGEEGK